jgi:hypothetical protein
MSGNKQWFITCIVPKCLHRARIETQVCTVHEHAEEMFNALAEIVKISKDAVELLYSETDKNK